MGDLEQLSELLGQWASPVRTPSPVGVMETCASDGSQSFGGSSACSMVAMAIRQAVVVIKMVACSHGGQLFGGRQGRGTGGVSMVIG